MNTSLKRDNHGTLDLSVQNVCEREKERKRVHGVTNEVAEDCIPCQMLKNILNEIIGAQIKICAYYSTDAYSIINQAANRIFE